MVKSPPSFVSVSPQHGICLRYQACSKQHAPAHALVLHPCRTCTCPRPCIHAQVPHTHLIHICCCHAIQPATQCTLMVHTDAQCFCSTQSLFCLFLEEREVCSRIPHGGLSQKCWKCLGCKQSVKHVPETLQVVFVAG